MRVPTLKSFARIGLLAGGMAAAGGGIWVFAQEPRTPCLSFARTISSQGSKRSRSMHSFRRLPRPPQHN
jgi:hypothetical protein